MIRTLCFTAALLAPGVAYAANPTATFSDQVVPAGSDPIACDIGPPAASIPPGAQAAGYTHCAANYDFTYVGNFTSNGITYNWSNQATWLGGCGASNSVALWFNLTGWYPGPSPCSDFDIEADSQAGGKNVLHIVWTPTDANNGITMSWIELTSNNNGYQPTGTTFPNGVYTEILWRSNQSTQNAFNDNQPHLSFFACSPPSTNPGYDGGVEWDVMESYYNGGSLATMHDPCAGAGTVLAQWFPYFVNPAGWTTGYHAMGTVASSNGSTTMGWVPFLDGVKQSGEFTFTPSSQDDFTRREAYGMGVGDQGVSAPRMPSNNMDMYVQHVQFWVLPGCTWQTQQCSGSIYE
jgi:hypothetical protein